MLKVYGAELCGDCRNFKAIQEKRGFEVEYVDITENVRTLMEFLALRDTDPIFDPVRARHGIGIPLFVREDGEKTFDFDEAFSWIGQPPVEKDEIDKKFNTCGIDGCK